jgi:hypothetical protein
MQEGCQRCEPPFGITTPQWAVVQNVEAPKEKMSHDLEISRSQAVYDVPFSSSCRDSRHRRCAAIDDILRF